LTKVLALLAALIVGGGITVAVTASQAGASSEFTLVAHETNFVFVQAKGTSPIPSLPLALGDRILVRSDLTENGVPVGYAMEEYTQTFNGTTLSDSVFALTDRGDMHASALVRPGPGVGLPVVWDLSVDGGTFAYRNAHGSAHRVRLPNNDRAITFALG
jgi:hypothetical protein